MTNKPVKISNLTEIQSSTSASADQDAIIKLLHSRFRQNQPYTHLGQTKLVMVNPLEILELTNDAHLKAYGKYGYKDVSLAPTSSRLEPHVYEMATRAYLLMRRKSEDQTIILRGSSGSGKSMSKQHIIKELLYLSNDKEKKKATQILGLNAILESFGTATTSFSDTASCFTQIQTLNFNGKGKVVGCNVSILLFDKFRISRNYDQQFNIFYQLMAGTTSDEKQALHITHDNFRYLGHQNLRNTEKDSIGFDDVKEALKVCGFKRKTIAQVCQLLAAILHLGNIQFASNRYSFLRDNSYETLPDGTFNEHDNKICHVKNMETLSRVATALGIPTSTLQTALTHRVKLIGNEFCSEFLTPNTASEQCDSLASTLYTALFLWITNAFNHKFQTDPNNDTIKSISILDTVGFRLGTSDSEYPSTFYDLCNAYLNEQLYQYCFDDTVNPESARNSAFVSDGIWPYDIPVQIHSMFTSHQLYYGSGNSDFALIPLINKESKRHQIYAEDSTNNNLLSLLSEKKNSNSSDYTAFSSSSLPTCHFTIRHYNTLNVNYSVDGFLESNLDLIPPEFIHMFQDNCTNDFLRNLFEKDSFVAWGTETHFRDEKTIIRAQLPVWSRPNSKNNKHCKRKERNLQTVFDQVTHGIDELKNILANTNVFEILHLVPNSRQMPRKFDINFIQQQMSILRITDLVTQATHMDTLQGLTFQHFVARYQLVIDGYTSLDKYNEDDQVEYNSDVERILAWSKQLSLTEADIQLGKTKVWLSFDLWRILESQLRSWEKEASQKQKADLEAKKEAAAMERENLGIHRDNDADITYENDTTEVETNYDSLEKRSGFAEDDTLNGFEANSDMSKMMKTYPTQAKEQIEEFDISTSRRWWTRFVSFATWYIPSFTLKHIGKMSRPDVQMAWREKFTLCLLIFLFSGGIIFFIIGLGQVICSGTKDLYSIEDVGVHESVSDYWVAVRGKVYDVTGFIAIDHGTLTHAAGKAELASLAGKDLSYTFPPPLTFACAGLVTDPSILLIPNETFTLGPFIHSSGPQQQEMTLEKLKDPYWLNKYFGPTMNVYKKGDIVLSMKQIRDDFNNWGRLIIAIDDRVYDITDYMATARRYPAGVANLPNYHFLDSSVETLFTKFGGKDATNEWNKYSAAMDEQTRIQNKACLDNVFYIGRVDYRDSLRCTFINYLLLSFAIIMCIVIVVKFLAALQFGSAPSPEDHDKFVICQVPCYTEDEESLRKTIESITVMDYDDRHKLLFLIADGMIIGSGNDKPTPQILLEILGHDQNDNPEALMFKSIGEGSKQLNYGKIYSGIFQHEGHVIPYVVVVKVGKPSERTKPGNRGKRDSQIICMNFLSKVHFDTEMTPLELEIYYHIKHIIGIEPSLYEYILMVDSDTEVYPDSLNRLISCMSHDSRIIGLCGETELGNEDRSWATMIQVYEYYISHHLVKSFESLFGSVTCLPGCFCIYRIRTPIKNQPLIISPNIIKAYSDNQVDTLHKKNLLHLGEDRYLTTLMMKTFPQYKMMFTPYAKCKTVAPDQWRVLLSQRRRWINSTIHNLLELMLLQQLCGFCCFSMRFIVMTDLIGTITLPSSVVYLVYLIYEVSSGSGPVPVIALGMLAGAYGLQSLIFIFKRQWQHVGWMIIYILAIPIFSFFIPIYAFWHFDDFSWGNTRVVVGDKTKQIIVTDDEKFDESMIPMKKWSAYEQEMWETKTLGSETTLYQSSHKCQSELSFSSQRKYRKYRQKYNDSCMSLSSYPSTRTHSSGYSRRSRRPHQPLIPGFRDDSSLGHYAINFSSPIEPSAIESLPCDDELEAEVLQILQSSNLGSLSKKQVRDQLSYIFGIDLTIKKDIINAIIERFLEQ